MPIFIAVVRVCLCCICQEQFQLKAGETVPEKCKLCNSLDWEWGPENRDSRFIRTGKKHASVRLNPGARSKKRRDQGKRQWQGFKPKPGEDKKNASDIGTDG